MQNRCRVLYGVEYAKSESQGLYFPESEAKSGEGSGQELATEFTPRVTSFSADKLNKRPFQIPEASPSPIRTRGKCGRHLVAHSVVTQHRLITEPRVVEIAPAKFGFSCLVVTENRHADLFTTAISGYRESCAVFLKS
jgi:hypothetical protein